MSRLRIAAVLVAVSLTLAIAGGAYGWNSNTFSSKVDVIVYFKDNINAKLFRQYGGEIDDSFSIIPAISGKLPEFNIEDLLRLPQIASVELDREVYILKQEIPWGVDRIDAEKVHPTFQGEGIDVAIIDTGIDMNHPDLSAPEKGIDYVDDDKVPDDEHGHGTHVAGIVAALNNDIGVVGVAPKADLLIVKALDEHGSGNMSDVIAGIDWAVQNGAEVISISLGTSTSSNALQEACDAAYERDVLLVAAAGNSGEGLWWSTVSYPAAYESVVAIAATDKDDERADFSSTGPEVELAAPGVDIKSTLPTYEVTMSEKHGYDYGDASGTSMACPHVSGTAALVFQSRSQWTNELVRGWLDGSSDDPGDEGRDEYYGYGLVDADEAALKMPTLTHVESINMKLGYPWWGLFTQGVATVTVFDGSGTPVAGVTVKGHWEGATSDEESGKTDSNGEVTFYSDGVSLAPSGSTFTFVVDSVYKRSCAYDESANKETKDSITA